MKNHAQELFLLTTTLSQLSDKDRIIRLFVESMNDIFPEYSFAWLPEKTTESKAMIEVCTRRKIYGFVSCTTNRRVDTEITNLINNATQLLAIFLEKIEQENLLLNKSEEKYRSLIDKVQAAIVLHDGRGHILTGNPMARRLLGVSEDQFLGRALIDPGWHFLREDGSVMPVADYPVSRVLSTRQPLRGYVTGIRRPGRDDVTWALVNAEPEYDDDGEIIQVIVSFIDITERKLGEEALNRLNRELRANEARFRLSQSAAHIGAWEYDLVSERFWGSDEAKRMYGFDPAAKDFSVETVESCIPERERVHQALVDLVENNRPYDLEFEINPVDGSEPKIISSIAELFRDEQNRPAKVFGVIQDITERKKTAAALRQSQALLSQAEEVAQSGSFDWDLKANAAMWSPGMHRLLEIPVDKFNGDPAMAMSVVHPDDVDILSRAMQDVIEERKMASHIEYRIVPPSGRVRHILAQGTLVLDEHGDPIRMVGVIYDITDRKRAEAEIERLKNHLANIIDSMPSMLVGMDTNKIVTQWNRQAETTTGIMAAEAVGKPVKQMFPDLSPHINVMMDEIKQHRTAVMEKLPVEKEEDHRLYDLMLYPLITDGTEGAVLRIEDVTEQARIQNLMIQTEKMMSLGGLAAGMAHEINNPLGIISQAAQNLERRIFSNLAANLETAGETGVDFYGMKAYFEKRQIPEFIESIRDASKRASRIIENILRFSRGPDSEMQPVSLVSVIDQALELAVSDYDLKKKFDFKSIGIVRDDAPDVPDIPMIAVEMEQVILNLLKNAAQAMAENPPDRKPGITIRLRRENRYVLMEVADNGSGMTEEVRRRVFEPFFTTKEPGIGTGLGLSVSYMIVTQNHKGLMEVDSTPGKGACFRVRLPLG